jgi:hypothetical protein
MHVQVLLSRHGCDHDEQHRAASTVLLLAACTQAMSASSSFRSPHIDDELLTAHSQNQRRTKEGDCNTTIVQTCLALPTIMITRAESSFLHMSCAYACVIPSNSQQQYCHSTTHNHMP